LLRKVTNLLTLNCLAGDIFNDTNSNQITLERQIIARYKATNPKDLEQNEGGKKKKTKGRIAGVLVEI